MENFDDLGMFLAKGHSFESQILNNIFFFVFFFLIHSFMQSVARNKYF